jgi:hypothetical protein
MQAFQFKIQIQDIQKPPVWRRVLVPSHITFDQFHQIIQAAFGWEDRHLYQFSKSGYSSAVFYKIPDDYDDEEDTFDSRTTFISEVFNMPKQTFVYIYDFGDDWKHKIVLEEISMMDSEHSICLAGKAACPPEDCGGVPGYYNLIEVLNDSKNPDAKNMRNWLGLRKHERWDVDFFDISEVNNRLSQLS